MILPPGMYIRMLRKGERRVGEEAVGGGGGTGGRMRPVEGVVELCTGIRRTEEAGFGIGLRAVAVRGVGEVIPRPSGGHWAGEAVETGGAGATILAPPLGGRRTGEAVEAGGAGAAMLPPRLGGHRTEEEAMEAGGQGGTRAVVQAAVRGGRPVDERYATPHTLVPAFWFPRNR